MDQVDYLRTRARALASLFGEVLPVRFGRNRVVRKLGEGAMGIVYLATDPSLDRECAVKVLHAADEDADRELLREARALASLSHPNVVQIYEITRYEQRTCIVMEYVEGPTLRAWLAERERSLDEVVDVFAQAGAGLAAAHAHGLVHRDFKPDNVLMGAAASVRPRVVDFGLARVHADSQTPPEDGGTRTTGLATLTVARVGTPAYMAPEQHEGAETDARCDQYAFCIALYEALQGERPFVAKTAIALFEAKCNERPVWPRGAPAWLRRVVERGLAPRPGDRFPHMGALLDRLRERKPPRGRLVLGGAAMSAAIVVAIAARPADGIHCEAGQAILGEAWNDARAQEIAHAFAATDLPYASEATERVRTILDERAIRWAALYDQVCAAQRDDGALDARMTCLRRQRDGLAQLVEVLVTADARAVERAVDAVGRIPAAVSCLESAGSPAVTDDARRVELDELSARLSDAIAHHRLGRVDEAWTLATALLDDARAVGDDALLSSVLFEVGSLADDRGDYPEAEALLRESAAIAIQARRDDLAAAAEVELVLVAGERQDRTEPLEDLVRSAEAALQRAGDPPRDRMRFHDFVGAALVAHGRHAEALPHYDRALALAEALDGPEGPSVAGVCSNYGNAKLAMGEPQEALAYLDRAESILREHLPHHPSHSAVVTNRALANMALGRFDAAVVDMQLALEMKVRKHGPSHPRLCTTLNGLAQTYHRLGKLDVALVYASWGFAVVSAHPEMGDTVEAAAMLIGWANVLQVLGVDLDEAERALQRAAENMRQQRHPQLSMALANLASLVTKRGEYERASVLADEAVEVGERVASPHAPMLSEALRLRGDVRTRLKRYDEAEADLRRALEIAEHNEDDASRRRTLEFLGDLEVARAAALAAKP